MSKRAPMEIGMVYEIRKELVIAIDTDRFIRCIQGKFFEKSQGQVRGSAHREITVEQLAKEWNISVEKLDEMSQKYFTPYGGKDASPSFRTAQRRNANRLSPLEENRRKMTIMGGA